MKINYYNSDIYIVIEAKIEKFLNEIGIKYEIMPCDPQLADTEDFCNYYNIPKSNSGNTIIIASKKDHTDFQIFYISLVTNLKLIQK